MSAAYARENALSREYLSRIEFLRRSCRNKKVLHLGCSSGRYIEDRLNRENFLHAILEEEASEIYGLDIHAGSLELLKSLGFRNLIIGDVERLQDVSLAETFDVVVAGDLLEHISRPGSMLDGVKRFMRPNGRFIVSTNNAFGLHYQLKRWLGRYTEHFEHVCFYSPETLLHLFERHGFVVHELYGAYTVPPHTRSQKLLFFLGRPLLSAAPVLAGTLIAVASLIHNEKNC